MANIRIKRTATGRQYSSTNTLLPGELGLAERLIWYGPKEADANDSTAVTALSLVSHQINNTFIGSNTFGQSGDNTTLTIYSAATFNDTTTFANAPTITTVGTADTSVATIKQVNDAKDAAIEAAEVTINNHPGQTFVLKTGSNGYLTIGEADSSGNITFTLNNLAKTNDVNTFTHKQTISSGGLAVTGDSTFANNVTISGNLTVSGTSTVVNTSTLKVEDQIIIAASGNTNTLTGYAGLAVPKYDGDNDGALVFDSNGVAYVGDVTLNNDGTISNNKTPGLQPLVTRSGLTSTSMVYWDNSSTSLKSLAAGWNIEFTNGTINALSISNPASSNKQIFTAADWVSSTNSALGAYQQSFNFEVLNYTDINYAVEVLALQSNGTYIEAPCVVVKDPVNNTLILYSNEQFAGCLIATSGGENSATANGHNIFSGNSAAALGPKGNLRFNGGLSASVDGEDIVVKLDAATSNTLGGVKIGNNISVDAAGSISLSKTNVVNALGYTPLQSFTQYTTHLYIGASSSESAGATTNGNTYIKLYDSSTARESYKISGSNGVSVSSDTNGNITIQGSTYSLPVAGTNLGGIKAGENNGTTSSFSSGGVIDIEIDCGTWT